MRKKPVFGPRAEPRAVHAEDAGRAQQPENVVRVGLARWQRYARHDVKGRGGSHDLDPLDGVEALGSELGPNLERGAKRDLVRPIAIERGGNRMLHRSGRAEPAVSQLLDRPQRIVEAGRVADRHPACPPAGREIRLRERRKRDDRGVGIAGGNRRDRAVKREVGVDLVGEQGEVVPIGELDERAADIDRVGRAGRIVGVDDDERAGRGGDQAAHMVEIGHPAAVGVGAVKHRARANFGEHGCVQWIGRYRNQHLVARLGERGECQFNPF